jgi:hypothetical protein
MSEVWRPTSHLEREIEALQRLLRNTEKELDHTTELYHQTLRERNYEGSRSHALRQLVMELVSNPNGDVIQLLHRYRAYLPDGLRETPEEL